MSNMTTHEKTAPRPMYDTRIPDAIDNMMFLTAGAGAIVTGIISLALVIMLCGMQAMLWLGAGALAFVAGTWVLAQSR